MADPAFFHLPARTTPPKGERRQAHSTEERTALAALHALNHTNLPSSDGQPMAESIGQLVAMVHSFDVVDHHFRHCKDVFVASDLLIHYPVIDEDGVPVIDEKGKPVIKSVAPDLFVAFGVESDLARGSYALWQEGVPPAFALEVVSVSSRKRDLDEKNGIYASLGVSEYFLFDPNVDVLHPPLQGFRLRGDAWERLPEEAIGGAGARGVRSETLGLALHWEVGDRRDERGRTVRELRWRDLATGEDLRTYEAQDAARRAAEQRAAEAEARIAELEARLGRAGMSPNSRE